MQKRFGRIKKYRKPYIVCENYTDIFSGNGCNWRFSEKSRYSFFVGISCVHNPSDFPGKLEKGIDILPVISPVTNRVKLFLPPLIPNAVQFGQ